MLTRKYPAVGHGALYIEEIHPNNAVDRDLVYVYDCGSKTSKLIIDRIDENFEENQIIDAVFISHLDDDHINGLDHLLRRCRVQHLYFPLISRRHLLLVHFLNVCNATYNKHAPYTLGFTSSFISNPCAAIHSLQLHHTPILHPVRPSENAAAPDDDYTWIFETIRNLHMNAEDIRSGSNVASRIALANSPYPQELSNWAYIPFNFNHATNYALLEAKLQTLLGTVPTPEQLLDRASDDTTGADFIKDCKKIYEKLFNRHNSYTMTLYSGPAVSTPHLPRVMTLRQIYFDPLSHKYKTYSPGCLYTGDYEAANTPKFDELQNAYTNYLAHIGSIQIPHHGSKYSYNPDLVSINHFSFISCNPSYLRLPPHAHVLTDLINRAIPLRIITDEQNTEVRIDVLRIDVR